MAPAAIAVVRGPDHVYELANEGYLRLVGRQEVVAYYASRTGRALDDFGFYEVFGLFRLAVIAQHYAGYLSFFFHPYNPVART